MVPSYRKLHDYMRDEYLPKTRLSDGMEGLPNGKAWYAYNVKRVTTTDYTPEQIHQIGLDEVKRIHREMEGVMKQVGFKGTRDEFFKHLNTDPQFFFDKREDLIAGYDAIRTRVNPQLPKLFEILPKADYEVRAVEPFREKSAAGGQYQAAERGRHASRHLLRQRVRPARASEVGDGGAVAARSEPGPPLPDLDPARTAGPAEVPPLRWLHRLQSKAGACTPNRWATSSACTPIRTSTSAASKPNCGAPSASSSTPACTAKGWTREQVLEYMDANSSAAEARRVSEAERYMAIPGQALAYKIGQLKISELRARAEKELGPKFDVRKFHTVVLADGALPLDVLEAKVDRWIASQR